MSCRRSSRGFTLIELLVVIGIIAVLIAILLPVLNSSRKYANRIKCLSNQRQLATSLFLYASESKGCFPPHLLGIANYQTDWAFYVGWKNPPNAYAADGYVGLGYLLRNHVIKDGQTFYCPEMQFADYSYDNYQPIWDKLKFGQPLTTKDRLHFGYLYRVFGSDFKPYITADEVTKINNLKIGKPKKMMVLTTDVAWNSNTLYWSHMRPYGLNVAFTDGHASFVQMRRAEYDAAADCARTYTSNGQETDQKCYYHYLYMAIERDEMPQHTKFTMARDWDGAMNYFGHF